MVTLIVFHHVQDYATWKQAFDAHEPVRRQHGALEHRVYQGLDDRNRVIVHNDFPDAAAAAAFRDDPSLAAALAAAGVVGEPWLGISEETEREVYREGEVGVTVAVHHRVRDYATWKPVFDEHGAVRRAHGQLGHRIYRPLGDPHALAIHNDFPTLAAAQAFGSDPSLPEAMARGGVEGEPGIGLITRSERKVYAAAAALA